MEQKFIWLTWRAIWMLDSVRNWLRIDGRIFFLVCEGGFYVVSSLFMSYSEFCQLNEIATWKKFEIVLSSSIYSCFFFLVPPSGAYENDQYFIYVKWGDFECTRPFLLTVLTRKIHIRVLYWNVMCFHTEAYFDFSNIQISKVTLFLHVECRCRKN